MKRKGESEGEKGGGGGGPTKPGKMDTREEAPVK